MSIFARAILAIAVLIAIVGCSTSTPGVRVVGDNVIELPAGDYAVFYTVSGGQHLTWTVTFDGEQDVNFSCQGLCADGHAYVPNVRDKDWANSSALYGRFDVTRVSKDAVHVYWPDGINLRE